MNFKDLSQQLASILQTRMPCVHWDGKKSILEMKTGGSTQWRQMEWIGFYFEFLCKRLLAGIMEMPGRQYGKTVFDGFFHISWDLKTHVTNSKTNKLIVNDSTALNAAIDESGAVGLILALGEAEYNDDDGSFRQWHSDEKGSVSKYVQKRIARGASPRPRKVSFTLNQIMFIPLTKDTIKEGGFFQRGFRNSAGAPRRSKLLLDLEKLNHHNMTVINF